jgi:hypothetical protein
MAKRSLKKPAPRTAQSEIARTELRPVSRLVESERVVTMINGLARIQCTEAEAAASLGVRVDEFTSFLAQNERSREAWELGPLAGRALLRRLQFKAAEAGDARMLAWMGRQYLDQKAG